MTDGRDELLRLACFAALDRLRARFGEEIPLKGGLDAGFQFDGQRVPFLNWQKGIFRAARQSGPAALAVMTSSKTPYGADEEDDGGFWYAYRRGADGYRDNETLRAAMRLRAPIVYYRATSPGLYTAIYPTFVEEDDPVLERVYLSVGEMQLGEAIHLNGLRREYAIRQTKVRLHQGQFRAIVLPAYEVRCAICRLKERRLLDAAHICPDAKDGGIADVTNGLSLCTIHHRAYDQNLVGVDADYQVRVSVKLLDEQDGPMLDLLKAFHGHKIVLPKRVAKRPNREFLAERYEQFVEAT